MMPVGVAGYKSIVKTSGVTTSFSDKAMSLVEQDDGEYTYQVDDESVEVWDGDYAVTFEDDGIEIDDNIIVSINYLFGKVTLSEEKTDLTVSGHYVPLAGSGGEDDIDPSEPNFDRRLAFCESYSLNIEGDELDKTGFKEAQDSDGARIREIGLIDSDIDLSGFKGMSERIRDAFHDRERILVEIIPGGGDVKFRGWYVIGTKDFSGEVSDLENEELSFLLYEVESRENRFSSMAWSDM